MTRFLATSVINDIWQFHLLHLGVLLLKLAVENQFNSNLIALLPSQYIFFTVRKSPELMKSGAVDSLTSFKTKTPLRDAASRIGDQHKYICKYKYTSNT